MKYFVVFWSRFNALKNPDENLDLPMYFKNPAKKIRKPKV